MGACRVYKYIYPCFQCDPLMKFQACVWLTIESNGQPWKVILQVSMRQRVEEKGPRHASRIGFPPTKMPWKLEIIEYYTKNEKDFIIFQKLHVEWKHCSTLFVCWAGPVFPRTPCCSRLVCASLRNTRRSTMQLRHREPGWKWKSCEP